MFNLDKFIADSVTSRPVSMFAADIVTNKGELTREIRGKRVCVIGGASSIYGVVGNDFTIYRVMGFGGLNLFFSRLICKGIV